MECHIWGPYELPGRNAGAGRTGRLFRLLARGGTVVFVEVASRGPGWFHRTSTLIALLPWIRGISSRGPRQACRWSCTREGPGPALPKGHLVSEAPGHSDR